MPHLTDAEHAKIILEGLPIELNQHYVEEIQPRLQLTSKYECTTNASFDAKYETLEHPIVSFHGIAPILQKMIDNVNLEFIYFRMK